MPKFLLTHHLSEEAEARLCAAGEVVVAPDADEATLCRMVADCDALVARTHAKITRPILEAGSQLRVVGVPGVGLNNVDVAAAVGLGIKVVNTPAAATDAVADVAVEMMLMLQRPISRLAAEYARGRFEEARSYTHGVELRELTIGIVGMGRIGSAVGRRCAAGFGARVIYNDIVEVGPFDFAAEAVDKPTLWARADVVTLHVPLTEQTRGLIGAEVLSSLRPGAMLINTARGAVVDTDALAAALQDGRLSGAAMDVTEPEPLPLDHPLFAMDSCIVTPHIAARTHGGLRRMFDVVDDVIAALRAT